MTITSISWSGCGSRIYTHIGVYEVLQQQLCGVTEVACSSAGSFMALATAVRASPRVVQTFFADFKRRAILPNHRRSPRNALKIMRHLGLDRGDKLGAMVRAYMTALGVPVDITHAQMLARYGVDMVVCATRVDVMGEADGAVYFSAASTPDVYVEHTMRATCTVPVLFQPVRIGQHVYVDGGVTDNLPLPSAHTVGVMSRARLSRLVKPTAFEYMARLLRLSQRHGEGAAVEGRSVISVWSDHEDSTDDPTPEMREAMLVAGRMAAMAFT